MIVGITMRDRPTFMADIGKALKEKNPHWRVQVVVDTDDSVPYPVISVDRLVASKDEHIMEWRSVLTITLDTDEIEMVKAVCDQFRKSRDDQ